MFSKPIDTVCYKTAKTFEHLYHNLQRMYTNAARSIGNSASISASKLKGPLNHIKGLEYEIRVFNAWTEVLLGVSLIFGVLVPSARSVYSALLCLMEGSHANPVNTKNLVIELICSGAHIIMSYQLWCDETGM